MQAGSNLGPEHPAPRWSTRWQWIERWRTVSTSLSSDLRALRPRCLATVATSEALVGRAKGVEGVPMLEARCECLRGERTGASGESEVSDSLSVREEG